MPRTVGGFDPTSLERSCNRRSNSIHFGPGANGVERADVYLSTYFYEPHRHDTYAIGITTAGVQLFRYRRSRHVGLPGQLHVLHPDEEHDGRAGTDDGFGYRILYIAPQLIRDALPADPLPFVADPVQDPTPMSKPITSLLASIDELISEIGGAEIAVSVADWLLSLCGKSRTASIDIKAVTLVRDYLAVHPAEQTPASVLEKIAGTDRFTIARHFRSAFGTSPDRFRTLRRLALARNAIESGQPLAQAAADAGFADQSHMSRQFKRAYGMTPNHWRELTAGSARSESRELGTKHVPYSRR